MVQVNKKNIQRRKKPVFESGGFMQTIGLPGQSFQPVSFDSPFEFLFTDTDGYACRNFYRLRGFFSDYPERITYKTEI